MAPILTGMLEDITNKIEAMETDTYNLDWGYTNVADLAHVDWTKCGASGIVQPYEGEQANARDGADANAYFEEVRVRIICRVPLDDVSINAHYDILKRLFLCLDDLKQCFAGQDVGGENLWLEGWKIEYRENFGATTRREFVESSDVFLPKRILTNWLIKYTQDRVDPEQHGDV